MIEFPPELRLIPCVGARAQRQPARNDDVIELPEALRTRRARTRAIAEKAAVLRQLPPDQRDVARLGALTFRAVKASDEEGIIIGKLSVAGNFDRENERVQLAALKAATYQLVRDIGATKPDGTPKVTVDLCHDKAIKADVLWAAIGDPLPDPNACYVCIRPHDRQIFEDAKAGKIIGMSFTGPITTSAAKAGARHNADSWQRNPPLVSAEQNARALATVRGESQPVATGSAPPKLNFWDEMKAAVHVDADPQLVKHTKMLEAIPNRVRPFGDLPR